MKTCEQCNEDYAAGSGVSEPMVDGEVPPHRLEERFCTKRCSYEYDLQFSGLDVVIVERRDRK